MNDERNHERWREAGWRRNPSPAEFAELRAWLAGHPQDRAEAQAEEALTRAVGRLRDVPVPSNFTARVLQAAQIEAAQAARVPRAPWLGWRLRRFPWLPKSAVVVILVGASVFSYHQVLAFQRAQLARSLVAVSEVALPSPQILTNFEAIQFLERTPPADVELLQLLK